MLTGGERRACSPPKVLKSCNRIAWACFLMASGFQAHLKRINSKSPSFSSFCLHPVCWLTTGQLISQLRVNVKNILSKCMEAEKCCIWLFESVVLEGSGHTLLSLLVARNWYYSLGRFTFPHEMKRIYSD